MTKKSKRQKISHATLETAPPAKKKQSGRGTWKLMDRASKIAAGVVAHRVSSLAWRAATGKKPPASTRHPELSKTEAVSWAVLAGVAVELSQVLIRRATATYWVKSTGHLPPGMKSLKAPETNSPVADEKPADPLTGSTGKTSRRQRRRRAQ